MKKRVFGFLCAAVFLLSLGVCAFADSPSNEARNSVVRLAEVFYANDEVSDVYVGTAFFVGKEGNDSQYLITNHHMVEKYLENEKGHEFKFRNEYGTQLTGKYMLYVFFKSGDFVEAYVVDYDKNQDIAILKLEKPTDKRVPLPLLVPDEKMVGDPVYVVGYPDIADAIMDTTSIWGVSDALISKGTIGRLVTESGSGTKWIQSSNLVTSSGNSGSPMLTEEGNVIGVVTASSTEDPLYLGANIEPVIDMLKKNAIDFDTAADRVKEEEPTEEPSPEPTAEETTAEPEPAAEEPVDKTLLYAGIGTGVFVLILIIVLIANGNKKKKRAKEEEEARRRQEELDAISVTVPAAPQEKPLRASVHSLAAQHGNQKVYLGFEPIQVGRSKDCKIMFKDDTPGVSSRHCSIAWDADNRNFVVRDLGSTYGTYLDSGMKLEPNKAYSLSAGESIYLGEKANMLRMEVE